jgi:hypothetical protein
MIGDDDFRAKCEKLERERDEARTHIANGDAFRDAVKIACDERLTEYKHEARNARAQAFAECVAIVLRVKADYVGRPEAFTLQNIADEIAALAAAGAKP